MHDSINPGLKGFIKYSMNGFALCLYGSKSDLVHLYIYMIAILAELSALNCYPLTAQTHLSKGSVELHCAELLVPEHLRASERQDGASAVPADALHRHASVQLHWVCRAEGEGCQTLINTHTNCSKENQYYAWDIIRAN